MASKGGAAASGAAASGADATFSATSTSFKAPTVPAVVPLRPTKSSGGNSSGAGPGVMSLESVEKILRDLLTKMELFGAAQRQQGNILELLLQHFDVHTHESQIGIREELHLPCNNIIEVNALNKKLADTTIRKRLVIFILFIDIVNHVPIEYEITDLYTLIAKNPRLHSSEIIQMLS